MDLLSVKQRFGIIGNSPEMNRAIEIAVRVAATDLTVMVTGESGVGKEFFPQIIHAYSARKHNKYIAVNCGAIPEGTIDSELFGHEKGSFTGANDSRKGYFEEADGGTIFLDEVAELPQSTQVRLLRVLQTGEFIRVGSSRTMKTNVRVVAATNIKLQDAINAGRFREDLFYRLNTVPLSVPPLRERKEDIYLLFRKFASDVAMQYRMPAIVPDSTARTVLENYYWPGNIRQLKNVAEQISAVEESRNITDQVLLKYLPSIDNRPVLVGSGRNDDSWEDKERFYRLLFEIKNELYDLKRTMTEFMIGHSRETRGEITALLPSSGMMQQGRNTGLEDEAMYAHSEVLSDEYPTGAITKENMQKDAIIKALQRNKGKRKDAARDLFISERTLYRKIKELGIDKF